MPSSTPKQARTMAAAAHSPAFAKKTGIPQKVGKEFNQADAKAKALALRARKPKAPPMHAEPDGDEGAGY